MSLFNLPTWFNKVQMGSLEAIQMAPIPIIIKIEFFNEANDRLTHKIETGVWTQLKKQVIL